MFLKVLQVSDNNLMTYLTHRMQSCSYSTLTFPALIVNCIIISHDCVVFCFTSQINHCELLRCFGYLYHYWISLWNSKMNIYIFHNYCRWEYIIFHRLISFSSFCRIFENSELCFIAFSFSNTSTCQSTPSFAQIFHTN